VAAFGQKLRGGRYTGDYGYEDLEKLARGARGEDTDGWRSEFLQLVRLAAELDRQTEKPGPTIEE
jgi:Ca-activated chloride channel family protein